MARSLSRLASVTFLGRVSGRVFSFGIYILISRTLGATALGSFAIGLVMVRIGATVAKLGMGTAAQRFIPSYESNDEYGSVTGLTLVAIFTPVIIGILLTILINVSFETISSFTEEPLGPAVRVLSLGIPLFGMMDATATATRGFRETKYSVYIRDVAQPLTALLFAAILFLIFGDLVAVVWGYVLSLLIAVILGIIFLNKLGAFTGLSRVTVDVSELFLYAPKAALTSVGNRLLSWTDVVVLTLFVASGPIGQYEAAFQVSLLLSFALASVNSIFPSVASNLYQNEDYSRLETMYGVSTKWITLLTAFATMFTIVFATEILSIFGNNFGEATVVLIIFAVMRLLVAVAGPAGFLLLMTDHENIELINVFLSIILNLGLNFLLIPHYGITGAAIATAITLSAINLARVVQIKSFLQMTPYTRQYLLGIPPLLLCLFLMLVGRTLNINPIIQIISTGTIVGLVFLVFCYRWCWTNTDQILFSSIE
ncbi:flippase [Halorubrum sp. SS5]|nr:flippase [Halorubrum sp. SS5]